eukprot:scaffold4454_cov411-Prasinococcus_capsulatus_cf.AAC.4
MYLRKAGRLWGDVTGLHGRLPRVAFTCRQAAVGLPCSHSPPPTGPRAWVGSYQSWLAHWTLQIGGPAVREAGESV